MGSKCVLVLATLLITALGLADQVWHGDSTPDVVDENLVISGACHLTVNHAISALTTNVIVTVEAFGDEQPVVRGPGKVLELITAAGCEIIFRLPIAAIVLLKVVLLMKNRHVFVLFSVDRERYAGVLTVVAALHFQARRLLAKSVVTAFITLFRWKMRQMEPLFNGEIPVVCMPALKF